MRFLILSRSAAIYSTRRLLDACEMEEIEAVVADPLDLALLLPRDWKASIHSASHALSDVDLVIPRIGTTITEYGLAVILTFVGAKMLAEHWIHIPTLVSLGIVVGVLAASIGASLAWPKPVASEGTTGSMFGR